MDDNSSNKEIEDALREFEVISVKRQQEKVKRAPEISSSDTPKMVEKTIKYSGGLIKDQRQAEYLLLVLVIIMFGLSLYFFFGGNNVPSDNVPISPDNFQVIP